MLIGAEPFYPFSTGPVEDPVEAREASRRGSGVLGNPRRRKLGDVSISIHIPDGLADRLAAEAARRGITTDSLATELLATRLPEEDALEAFIGSGASGRGNLGRNHREIRAELTKGLAARDL